MDEIRILGMGLELKFAGKRPSTVSVSWRASPLSSTAEPGWKLKAYGYVTVLSVVLLTLHCQILHEALRSEASIQRQKVIVYSLLLAPQRIHTELQVAHRLSGLHNSHTHIRITQITDYKRKLFPCLTKY
jgi:hypothetical protein